MTLAVAWKLLAIFATVWLGWFAARAGWVGGRPAAGAGLPAATRTLSDVAFHLFVPALLFRTMARQDLATVPWAPSRSVCVVNPRMSENNTVASTD